MAYSDEIIEQARILYDLGAPAEEIRRELDLANRRVVYQWAKRFKWDQSIDTRSLMVKTAKRLNWLLEKDPAEKSDADRKESLHLGDLLLKLEKAAAFDRGESPGSKRGRKPGQKNGTGKRRSSRKKNDVTHLTADVLQDFENRYFYEHQKVWLRAGEDPETFRRRFILKSRQVGATLTFAWEAFKRAITHGHDQIFISSTKRQAEVFKAYIATLATLMHNEEWAKILGLDGEVEVELTGNPTKLITEHGTVEIHYLSPNSFANSQSGDVYFDEVFYTRNFARMEAVAKPMATLKQYRQTYFGAPTAISHDAYEKWSGKHFTKHHKDVEIDVLRHEELYHGRLDPDGFWRCVCTLDSAIEMGWDKADKDQLLLDTPDPKQFANIYNCEFIDDSFSVFSLSQLLDCGVDPLSWFPEFDADNTERPAGDALISVGYDPAGDGDNAAISVTTWPQSFEEKFRLYEKQKYRGMPASIQAGRMVDVCRRFNVGYMDIDKSGPGLYVPGEVELALQAAELDSPRMVAKQYSVQSKAVMVQKALNVISQKRFEYDEDDTTLPLAFMSIRQGTTPKSNEITYYSTRDSETGHGDEAWSTMHAFMCEPLNPRRDGSGSSVAFSS